MRHVPDILVGLGLGWGINQLLNRGGVEVRPEDVRPRQANPRRSNPRRSNPGRVYEPEVVDPGEYAGVGAIQSYSQLPQAIQTPLRQVVEAGVRSCTDAIANRVLDLFDDRRHR